MGGVKGQIVGKKREQQRWAKGRAFIVGNGLGNDRFIYGSPV